MPSSTNQLVEHFFRHESANLIAVLTRAFGIRRIDLIEDMVQVAILEAKVPSNYHAEFRDLCYVSLAASPLSMDDHALARLGGAVLSSSGVQEIRLPVLF